MAVAAVDESEVAEVAEGHVAVEASAEEGLARVAVAIDRVEEVVVIERRRAA